MQQLLGGRPGMGRRAGIQGNGRRSERSALCGEGMHAQKKECMRPHQQNRHMRTCVHASDVLSDPNPDPCKMQDTQSMLRILTGVLFLGNIEFR